ncbi:FtsX-like permease family protein [[Clostridium] symbiosum]|uniref:ABC transporter permease n=1 Tax=Clostridium symbiosum TaxID=1512 RepID=UPI001D07DAD4|nr:ABC transporter permease [[Clostridium] symbiosum]MCB6608571.1 ABC transporter permease [[Clostridium] symbiosum]MCB6931737.1 ABC transporter permease [[Clostridium] symbiosum]
MNIFDKVALQGLRKNRARTLVTIAGVALSAALITAVATFSVSLQTYLINGAIEKTGDWHVEFYGADSSFVQEQAADDRIKNASFFENIGYASLEGGINPDKPYLFIAGFNRETFDMLPVHLLSGRLPENSGEILVPAHVAANGGVKISIGDTLIVPVGTRQMGNLTLSQHDPYRPGEETLNPEAVRTYKVVGIFQRPAFEERSAPGYTLITIADSAAPGNCLSAFITLKNPHSVRAYADGTAGGLSYVLNDDVLRFMGISDDTLFNTLLYSTGAILIALVMTGSVFLIYNSFNISLNERTHQFGILMSVGATEKQLRSSVLFEGLVIGAIGIPLGILIGIPSIQFVISLVAGNFGAVMYDSVPLTLCISLPAICAAAVISMITILISAYIPARKAARTPVMECICQTNEIKVEPGAVKTSKFAGNLYGLEGTLALKNFKRNKRRYRSIVLSLTLSVVLFVSTSSFAMNLNGIANQSAVEMDGDVVFYTKDTDENELLRLYGEMETAAGVYRSTHQAVSTYTCEVDTGDFTTEFRDSYLESQGLDANCKTVNLSMDVQFIEEDIYGDFLESLGLPASNSSGQNEAMIIVGKKPGNIDIFKNKTMDFTIRSESGEAARTIHTLFADTYPLDPPPLDPPVKRDYVLMVVAPYTAKPQFDLLGAPERQAFTFWSKTPGLSAAQMQAMIDGAGLTSSYNLFNLHAVLEENRNILFIVNLFTVVFVIMISLIGTANVFNTISTNIRLRRRELAMLRSVGLSDRSFNRMMRFECALYGIRTLLFGLPISGVLSWLIYRGMVLGGGEIRYIFPWGSIAVCVLGVFFVIFITMLYATGKIRKENIIDALRDDMT